MQTITDITLNQINAALLSLKRDFEKTNSKISLLEKENESIKEEIEKLKTEISESESTVEVQNDEEPIVEEINDV